MRGFFTNPSRADDSFIPFKSKSSGYCGEAHGVNVGADALYSTNLFIMNFNTGEGKNLAIYRSTTEHIFSDDSRFVLTSPSYDVGYGGTVSINIEGKHKIFFQNEIGIWDSGTQFTDTYTFTITTSNDTKGKIFKID